MLEEVRRDQVEFVSLQFSDLLGVPKEVVIPVSELESVLNDGLWFDGSSIEGFARIQESDMFLKPDVETYSIVPWTKEKGRTARFICDIYRSDGTNFEGDPRYILKRAILEAKEKGYDFEVGPEMEFYLLKRCDRFETLPLDYNSYFDLLSASGYEIIREIVTVLMEFGIKVETSHHEVGSGQYEIDFNYGAALDTADRVLTLKYAVKKIAQMHELRATFMPKPIKGIPGSGMHIHQSLFDLRTGENLFYDEDDEYHLSKLAYNFLAGQISHIKGMCAILCPTINSYKRLVSGFEAPVYISWGSKNRSALIRIPQWFKNRRSSARLELRSPDPTCNPYLAFAVMLRSGLDGVLKNISPPKPVEENIYHLDSEVLRKSGIDQLPTSLMEALDELKSDKLIQETLGNHMFERYISVKTREIDEYKMEVTPWEIDKYLNIF